MSTEHQQQNQDKPKKLSWLDLFRWAFYDTVNKTYTSEQRSRFYDRMAHDFFHRNRLGHFIANKIIELFPVQHPYICERAAGSGIITEILYQRGLTKIRASDLSESQLLLLQEKLEGIEIAVENFNEPMPEVSDDSFDVVFQVGATRFMTHDGQQIFIDEAARTLKEGGILIWPVMWAERPLSWIRKGKGPQTTSYSISRKLEAAGLDIIAAPWVFHGRMGILTTTLLIAKKMDQPIQRSAWETINQLWSKWSWEVLKREVILYIHKNPIKSRLTKHV